RRPARPQTARPCRSPPYRTPPCRAARSADAETSKKASACLGPPSLLLRRPLEHLDLDATEGHLVAVVLEVDLALLEGAELFPLPELAPGDAAVPVFAAQLVADDLLAVEPVLDVVAVDDDPRLVPLADGPGRVLARGVQAVARR